jgi:hypothetical protein
MGGRARKTDREERKIYELLLKPTWFMRQRAFYNVVYNTQSSIQKETYTGVLHT